LNFGVLLGFAKAQYKTYLKKSGRGLRLEELPQTWEFPFIISVTAEASNLSIGGYSLNLPRSIIKTHPTEKVGVDPG